MKRVFLALITLISTSAGAASPEQFDLLCRGIENVNSSGTGKSTKQFEKQFRVDLSKGVYCEEQCRSTRKLAEIAPAFLMLQKEHVAEPGRKSDISISVDRVTGKYTGTMTLESRIVSFAMWTWDGQCERKSFSGFPQFEVKF
ncbi:hypothetical protein LH19_06970 [Sphingopyxis macrogoltabida]|nr:hypothetical protein LH19_06970 [Sphingopyxis macrogoltabida]